MKADSLTAKDLFGRDVRYVIPDFQRPYVWSLEDQWEPFWEDVQYAAERFLEEADRSDLSASIAEAERRAGRHFLCAVVVKQLLTGATEIETHEVIDGQQRLITLQILIDAVHEVAEAEGWDEIAEGLEDLVLNKKRHARRDPDRCFKVWPTAPDRDAFRAAMTNGASTVEFAGSKLVEAHEYFQTRVRDWATQDLDDLEARLEALNVALLGLLELIVIDLGESDDPFVIFETLNARGTPLLASDLVKNFLLQRASARGLATVDVAREYWDQFAEKFWSREIRQGRLRRPRVDVFLDYWLEHELVDEVASHEVFPKFKTVMETAPSVIEVAESMRRMATVYRNIEQLDPFGREGTFYYRWDEIDARTLTPLLMWLFSHDDATLPLQRRTRCLVALESFLVRRMVNRMTTKNYNRFFLDTLRRLREAAVAEADDVLIRHLAEQTADSSLWPSDEEVREAFLDRPVYTLLARKRVRLVLEAIEDAHRGAKSEDEHVVRRKLEIEHVMPQAWRTHWPLPGGGTPLEAEIERKRLVQTFGNLTLARSTLNRDMSNHSWDTKRKHLEDNSTLLLNREILRAAAEYGAWDEATIRARSLALYERAVQLWPRG